MIPTHFLLHLLPCCDRYHPHQLIALQQQTHTTRHGNDRRQGPPGTQKVPGRQHRRPDRFAGRSRHLGRAVGNGLRAASAAPHQADRVRQRRRLLRALSADVETGLGRQAHQASTAHRCGICGIGRGRRAVRGGIAYDRERNPFGELWFRPTMEDPRSGLGGGGDRGDTIRGGPRETMTMVTRWLYSFCDWWLADAHFFLGSASVEYH